MDTMPSTAEELKAVRARCESFGLRLSAVEVGSVCRESQSPNLAPQPRRTAAHPGPEIKKEEKNMHVQSSTPAISTCTKGGPPMDLIVQGKPGRDEQIEHYKKCIRAMGEAGIPVLCPSQGACAIVRPSPTL